MKQTYVAEEIVGFHPAAEPGWRVAWLVNGHVETEPLAGWIIIQLHELIRATGEEITDDPFPHRQIVPGVYNQDGGVQDPRDVSNFCGIVSPGADLLTVDEARLFIAADKGNETLAHLDRTGGKSA